MLKPLLHKAFNIIGLVGLLVSIIAIGFKIVQSINAPDQKNALERLKIEFTKIDKFSNASVVHGRYTSSFGKTSIDFIYSSRSPDKEILDYYNCELSKNGWQLVGQKKIYDWGRDLGGKVLTYNKLNLFIDMQYSGDRKGYGWAYSFFMKAE